ncbi:MAG: hypothetical protein ACRELF_12500, partial [Gemmataceae bacterium]
MLLTWIARALQISLKPSRRRRRAMRRLPTPTFRPRLEILEDRVVPSAPDTINVASGNVYGQDGLIAALNTANTDNQPTTIILAPGTYTVTSVNNVTATGANGLPVVTGNVTIVGNDSTI